jgi:flagellin
MTRINTNVSSLVAQNTLGRSNAALSQALTRLSTGLRINTGKDDPAGLIASENLRSDITSIKKAITNTDRANQVIATADSALGQVSSLLNDIRGLVTESANEGALSEDQIAANQLQIDSSLEALNRIAQTTTFQGRKLLDGSLDFITSAGTNFTQLSDLKIDQANLGATGSISVAVDVTTAATQAQVDIENIPAATAAVNATSTLTLSSAERQAVFALTFDTTTTSSVTITAVNGGAAEGADGNGITVVLAEDAGTAGGVDSVAYVDATNTLTVNANFASGTVTDTEVAAAIQASGGGLDFTAVAAPGGANLATADIGTYASGSGINYTTTGRDIGSLGFEVQADTAGAAANGVTVTIAEDAGIAADSVEASIDVNGDIEVLVNGTVTKAAIVAAIDGLTGYSATALTSTGNPDYIDTADTPPGVGTLAGGVAASGGLSQDAVFSLSGLGGSEVFNFEAGSSISQLAAAINLVQDATGVEATVNGTTLELLSSTYGSAAFVDIQVIDEAAGGTIQTGLGATTSARDNGTDIVASINGISAKSTGNVITINTATLDLTTTVSTGFTGSIAFDITGGGAQFQLGPEVVSNQQARIGVTSVNTARLGGVSGKLFSLGSGGSADLDSDTTVAAQIVDEAINQVTGLRGRLGAFQRTSLETNKNALNDTLVNLTDAESQIRDADFASETAALTRAQILVQSGTVVLQISNQNPQNVLALLQG